MDEKKKMLLADFALLLAATFWGMGFVAGDMAAKAFPTFWIMAVRFLGAAVWMGLLFRRAVKSSTKEDIKAGMILGGLLFLAQPLQIIALRYTTPSKQAFLVTTYVKLCRLFRGLCCASVHRIRLLPQGQWRFSELG